MKGLKKKKFINWEIGDKIPLFLTDFILLSLVIVTGWFLIGYYLRGNYLAVPYQDWIYHAWRIKTLMLHGGMPSWDYIWSNGLNHWVSYHYVQHWLVLILLNVVNLSITKAMLLLTVVIFLGLRILMYVILRFLGIRPVISFLAVILSYVYAQQWVTVGDFSIFVAFILVPFYIFLWINIYSKFRLVSFSRISLKSRLVAEFVLAGLTGSLWLLHPVVANALGGLFFFSIGMRAIKISWVYFSGLLFVYILGALPFFGPYLAYGYHVTNPVFLSTSFVRDTIAGDFFGLSGYFVASIGILWLIIIFMAQKVSGWAKSLASYSTLYLLIIYLASLGYIPKFILQLQISRVIPVLALLLSFAFAGALNGVFKEAKNLSRGIVSVFLVFSVIGISEAIGIATVYTGQPVYRMDDPVSIYFNNNPLPEGSIYVKNVSKASYFGALGLRFVNSYNEHLLPHPLSLRYSYFMRSEIAYTGIPKAQVDLIDAYSLVLGVQYLVLPANSPLVKRLTEDSKYYDAKFEYLQNVESSDGVFVVLKNKRQINNSYLVGENESLLFWSDNMPAPTLDISSYKKWDKSIKGFAEKILNGKISPFSRVKFIDTDKLFVPISNLDEIPDGFKILITQSYDNLWFINGSNKMITPSETRFIVIDVNQLDNSDLVSYGGEKGILLYHRWAVWHWPLQSFGLFLVSLIILIPIVRPRIFFKKLS